MIRKFSNELPHHILMLLYNSLFLSNLHYGIEIWGNNYSNIIKPLYNIQKKILKIIYLKKTNTTYNSQYTNKDIQPLPIYTNTLTIKQITEYKILCYMYKNKNRFKNNINKNNNYNLRNNNEYEIKNKKFTLTNNSLLIVGIKLWNKLDENIKKSKNINIFKRKIKKILISENN